MAGGQALDFSRMTAFRADPDGLVIVGFDTNDRAGEHPLWNARVLELPDPRDVAKLALRLAAGEVDPKDPLLDYAILAREFAQHGCRSVIAVLAPNLVIYGRRRVIAGRAAKILLIKLNKPNEAAALALPVMHLKGKPEDLLSLAISENRHRRADSILADARHAHALAELAAGNEAPVMCAFNVSATTAKGLIALGGCSDTTLGLVSAKKIGVKAAMRLARKHPEPDKAIRAAAEAPKPPRKGYRKSFEAEARKLLKELVSGKRVDQAELQDRAKALLEAK